MVNDHITSCHRHAACAKMAKPGKKPTSAKKNAKKK
jgi:hypothetical protein